MSKRRLTLRAAPDVPGTSDGAKVMFSVDWPGSAPQEACVADAPTAGGVWQCEVDLAALQAPAGSLKLNFEVRSEPGAVEPSPDGKRTIDYRPAAPRWRAARQVLPEELLRPQSGHRRMSGYHVAATCDDKVGYAEGSAAGRWTSHVLEPPARHTESGPQVAIDGRDLYIAYTRYGPPTEADTCGGPFPRRTRTSGSITASARSQTASGRSQGSSAAPTTSWTRCRVADGRLYAGGREHLPRLLGLGNGGATDPRATEGCDRRDLASRRAATEKRDSRT